MAVSPRTAVEWVLLGLMLLGTLLSIVGLVRSRDAMAAIHCASFAGYAVGVPFAAAVVVGKLGSEASVKAIVLLLVVLATSPLCGHALARAVYQRSRE